MAMPPSAPTPSTAAPLAPALYPNARPTPSPTDVAQSRGPGLVTQKEWVIPPRPRPGRKPATDTPPTRRKAQNRAAQQAFRARRAAKVGELEGSLKEIGQEHERSKEELKAHITVLEAEVDQFKGQLLAWQQRYEGLAQELLSESQARERLQTELDGFQDREASQGRDVALLPPRRSPPEQPQVNHEGQPTLMGCGSCTIGSRCECVEQAINLSSLSQTEQAIDSSTKRSHSPENSGPDKRSRGSRIDDHSALEIDFTDAYSRKKREHGQAEDIQPSTTSPTATHRITAADRCGFCKDDTLCVCAELSNDDADIHPRSAPHLSQFTPPPSENDVHPASISNIANPTPLATSASASTLTGPGTCAQCRADPNSTLFCKSLAAMSSSSSCCGAYSASSGGCCRSASTPTTNQSPSTSEKSTPHLSCADTYTTLSRHPHYAAAMEGDELGSWLGRLKPKVVNGRTAMEVEAASVMGVLKHFDRRFGAMREQH